MTRPDPSRPELSTRLESSPESTGANTLPVFLTVDELAEVLRVNRKTVYEALARGGIPGARKIGNTYRIHRETVMVWFASATGRVSQSARKR